MRVSPLRLCAARAAATSLLLFFGRATTSSAAHPVVKPNPENVTLYDEAIPMLCASKLAYDFGDLVKEARNGKIDLVIPKGFPVACLKEFQEKSIDFRGVTDENGTTTGLSLLQIDEFLKANEGNINATDLSGSDLATYIKQVIENIKHAEEVIAIDEIFLATYRSIQQAVSCVYGVLKDRRNKRIIVTFRGSQNPDFSTRDWRSNTNARVEEMRTPKLIQDKMTGSLKERILVHRGFYAYLFDNSLIDGDQRFDRILDDIKPLMEKGYSIYVTGHSLGGALATMFSFKLAGSGNEWIPRPITCISYAAPFSGTDGYRTAFEQLEKDGLLRHLRVNNAEDFVPTIPFMSHFGWKRRTFKHVGINLRLTSNGFDIIHTSNLGLGVWNAMQNSIFKPVWSVLTYHGLPLHDERMTKHIDELRNMTIDGLYRDENVVGKSFKIGSSGSSDKDEL